jgi:1-deoxy-D-xylulose-5-phosphate reductoisomerase
MKRIALLGSTGSIGRNTLDVIRNLNRNGYPVSVEYLTAYSNSNLLLEQINEFKPRAVVVFSEAAFESLKHNSGKQVFKLLFGNEGIKDILSRDNYELVVNAMVGFSGLIPTLEAVKNGKDIALANKESLVIAGELINEKLKDSRTKITPIDSEHSAILQCIRGESYNGISKLILTASGGPFLKYSRESLKYVSVEQALAHPNWKMGKKITIDSATLMNKGFEIIEGRWLFDIPAENIEVIIHPQSIVHSFVEFQDGSVKAQLGVPDMRIPIQYALTYPERAASDFPRLDFSAISELTFFEPDFEKFECLNLAYEVLKKGGTYPVVLNASNEAAVDLFLKRKIKFPDIAALIKSALDSHTSNGQLDVKNITEIDKKTREFINISPLLQKRVFI